MLEPQDSQRTYFQMARPTHYLRPPIVEAVIELRFEGDLTPRDLERLRDRFKSHYPTVETIQTFEVLFEGNTASPKVTNSGFKMTSKNAVDVLMVQPTAFGTIRLAPYENWEAFRSVAQTNWERVEKTLKEKKKITRIGVRFINRIDIPVKDFSSRPVRDFFPTFIHLGSNIADKLGAYSFSMSGIHTETGAKLTLQSSTLQQPALLEHVSVALDVDTYWDSEIPQRVDEMWVKADKLREAKNSVFENSISDLVRDLFK